jgi:glycine/D-amino acid oxidase-like deaminating enzyme
VVTGGRSFAWSRGASHRLAVESLRQNFAVLLPGHAHLLSGRVASRVRACIVDGLPVIGPASTIDNLYFGLHRSDFRGMLAPAVGLLSAQAVAARQVSDPATPYSMERFPQSAPGGQRRVKD